MLAIMEIGMGGLWIVPMSVAILTITTVADVWLLTPWRRSRGKRISNKRIALGNRAYCSRSLDAVIDRIAEEKMRRDLPGTDYQVLIKG